MVRSNCLLLLLLVQCWRANSHIFFVDPEPRSCFYGGYWGLDPDGPWRREPCDRDAIPPQVVYAPGDELCLKIQEFVEHPGSYDISIAYSAVGPDDSNVDWTPLVTNVPDVDPVSGNPGGQTGYPAFIVTLPLNRTCDHCTIQVRQFAQDLDYFYYACTDIAIVDGVSNKTVNPSDCQWSPGPPLLRAMILLNILIGTMFLLVLLSIGICCYRSYRLEPDENALQKYEEEEKDMPAFTKMSKKMKQYVVNEKRTVLLLILFVTLYTIITFSTFISLKACAI